MKRFGLHINAVNGQCKCSPFRLQCLLFALTSVFWSVWAFHHVLFVCMFCSRCSLFSLFFKTQELVFKRRKTCQGSRKSTHLSSSSLFNSFSFHFVHSLLLLSTVVVQLCVCGGERRVLPLRGFLFFFFLAHSPRPPSSMGPSSLLTAPTFC